ncbi:MAG TPA: hypothetical protein DCE41_04210 [Cytophagales bacterium]|nr:hypothetical protein [Cytophagales bacterium]HAA20525.1 hypothetical protein [Cytophagales bacterium]HAP61493.1 hypothetical protein [Cytophagales bacterium]
MTAWVSRIREALRKGWAWLKARPGLWLRLWERTFSWLNEYAGRLLKRVPLLYFLFSLLFSLLKTYPRILSPHMWRRYPENLRQIWNFIRRGFIDVSEPVTTSEETTEGEDSAEQRYLRARVYAFGDTTFYFPSEDFQPPQAVFDRLLKRVEYALFSPFLMINHIITGVMLWRQSDKLLETSERLLQFFQ